MSKEGFGMTRRREFEMADAIDRALRQFWEKGYDGTSISDLTQAMGINRSSLYATFGSKQDLFLAVIERYSHDHTAYVRDALAQTTALGVATFLLSAAASAQTNPSYPRGCLEMQAALACSSEAEPIRRRLSARRQTALSALAERFDRARREGDLPSETDPLALARFLSLIAQGMAVQAVDGATRDDLEAMREIALQSWPGTRSQPSHLAVREVST
jgi:AcrR family transcriptional regulator